MQANNCDNKCGGCSKKIIKVIIKTKDDDVIIGYVCVARVRLGEPLIDLLEDNVVVFTLSAPNTGRPEQAGYSSIIVAKDQISKISKCTEVDPEIEGW